MGWYFSDACDQAGTIIQVIIGAIVFLGLAAAAIRFVATGHEALAALFILLTVAWAVGGLILMVRR